MSKPEKKKLTEMSDEELRAYVKSLIKKEGLPTPELTEELAKRILRNIFSADRDKR